MLEDDAVLQLAFLTEVKDISFFSTLKLLFDIVIVTCIVPPLLQS